MSESNPVGRPSEYRQEYCNLLIEHMASGLSYESFAGVVRVTRSTIYLWEQEHPEFSDAKQRGFEACRVFWEKLGVFYIVNGQVGKDANGQIVKTKEESLNAAVWIFNMKNRFKWRDKQPDEDKTELTVNIHGAIMKELKARKKNASSGE